MVSSSVRCTAGCPLPPFEQATADDLVHAGASIIAVGLVALAMLLLALGDSQLRSMSRLWFAVTAPVIAILGILLLAVGRSTATAVTERVGLTAVLGWLIAVSVKASVAAPLTFRAPD
jgi:hypothetical protein